MTEPPDPFAVPGQPAGQAAPAVPSAAVPPPAQHAYPPVPPATYPPPPAAYPAPPTPPGYGPPPPGYPPNPYAQQAYAPGYGPPAPTNGLAIASMVLGILWIFWLGSLLALIFGFIAKSQIKQRGESGGGMATAGIVLGFIGAGTLVLEIIGVALAFNSPGSGY